METSFRAGDIAFTHELGKQYFKPTHKHTKTRHNSTCKTLVTLDSFSLFAMYPCAETLSQFQDPEHNLAFHFSKAFDSHTQVI